ncbi:hypothetical protein HDU96_000761 [Phlyctochytrium bullatum]|nr:hypothetical protein HDU96_000761 [Phlyctochytrium bullatum]
MSPEFEVKAVAPVVVPWSLGSPKVFMQPLMPALGHTAFPTELLRSVLIHVHPNDLISIAAANRHLRSAVPACIDFPLAKRQVSQLTSVEDSSEDDDFGDYDDVSVSYELQDQLRSIRFDHPLLRYFHTAAAVGLFGMSQTVARCMWGSDWKPSATDPKSEALRLHRVHALRAAVQKGFWPTPPFPEGWIPPQQSWHQHDEHLENAATMAAFMKSTELLDDICAALSAILPEGLPLHSPSMQKFLFASAEVGFCNGLALIPPHDPILSFTNDDGNALLEQATDRDPPDLRTVQLLLEKGAAADPNHIFSKWTPVTTALFSNNLELLRLLLQHGADPHRRYDGSTALNLAAALGFDGVLALLLEFGGDPDVRDDRGDTPLLLAAKTGNTDCVRLLLDAGADVNAVDGKDMDALACACAKGKEEVAEVLRSAIASRRDAQHHVNGAGVAE